MTPTEPDYTHPDEMPTVEHMPSPSSDLRGTIVHFTSEMLDNPNDYGIYPTTNFYNDLEEAILDWHNKQIEEIIKKPHILPKNAQHQESVKQGINFYHRQMRKRVDKLKEVRDERMAH